MTKYVQFYMTKYVQVLYEDNNKAVIIKIKEDLNK